MESLSGLNSGALNQSLNWRSCLLLKHLKHGSRSCIPSVTMIQTVVQYDDGTNGPIPGDQWAFRPRPFSSVGMSCCWLRQDNSVMMIEETAVKIRTTSCCVEDCGQKFELNPIHFYWQNIRSFFFFRFILLMYEVIAPTVRPTIRD